uniref:Uncharacterized protein n=1 Tax=Schistosoma haematobium TaxID=6185 RepID=A0A094ZUH0_SCHHA
MTGILPVGHYGIPETVQEQQEARAKKSIDLYKLVTKILDFILIYPLGRFTTYFTIVVGEVIVSAKSLRKTHHRIPVVLYPIYDSLIVACFGYFATIGLTDVGKVSFGRLRPNFLDACKPSDLQTTILGFVGNFTCSSDKSSGLSLSGMAFCFNNEVTGSYTRPLTSFCMG